LHEAARIVGGDKVSGRDESKYDIPTTASHGRGRGGDFEKRCGF